MAEKNRREQKKELARSIYFSTDITGKELSGLVGVSEVTTSKWISEGKWKELKSLQKADKDTAKSNLYKILIELTSQTEVDKINADAISKVTKAIEVVSDDRVTIPNKMHDYREFINWCRKQKGLSLDLIKQINALQNEHIQDLIKNVAS